MEWTTIEYYNLFAICEICNTNNTDDKDRVSKLLKIIDRSEGAIKMRIEYYEGLNGEPKLKFYTDEKNTKTIKEAWEKYNLWSKKELWLDIIKLELLLN